MHDWTGSEIAIVGAAGRFPGARTLAEFWALLSEGREAIRDLTDEELDAAGVSATQRANPQYVRRAAVLDEVGWWDARFWGFSPKDAAIMDPQHRLFLECAYEALEHAGIAPDQAPGRIGVYAGVGMGSWFQQTILRNRALLEDVGMFLLRHTGNDKDFLATRVSYELDLRGPSVSVQTACSTSLVAIHLASQALLSGETDVALAGAVTIEIPNTAGYLFKENEILAPDGRCRAFDAEGAGTVFGSGAGVVVLRRLQDAIAAGDHIMGVIRGAAVNNDGAGKIGYLAPSVDGQAQAIAEAIEIAEITADTIDYVEAHGTGTRVGDPIEVAALTQAFRRTTQASGYCGLGSVKSNIGHLDTAAGVASVIKVILALQHGELPPSLHFQVPNPLIDFATSPFRVVQERRSWPASGRPRRAGVSSLGVGGTNAHLVIEEAPPRAPSVQPSRRWQLLPFSARTESAVPTMAANLADYLREQDSTLPLADVAWTLQTGRLANPYRSMVVASSLAEAAQRLEEAESDPRSAVRHAQRTRSIAFTFAGGGAQAPGMAKTLYESEPVFRTVMDEALGYLEESHALAVREALLDSTSDRHLESEASMERPSIGLPALLIMQVALARVWMHWGVTPTILLGHSMGEYSAAHLSGVFSLRDVVRLVALRGRLFEQVAPGGMLSVSASLETLTPLLPQGVTVAAINAPALTVVSGALAGLSALEARLQTARIEYRRVRIAVPAHSALLDPILPPFEAFLRTAEFGTPAIPFVSNRTGQLITDAEAIDPVYWVRHLRETVNFADGLKTVLAAADRLLIEIGPGRSMTQLALQHPARTDRHTLVSSLSVTGEAEADAQAALLTALGTVWCHGGTVEWARLHDEPRQRIPLPTYPWERKRFWIDRDPDRIDAQAPASSSEADERREDIAQWFHEMEWVRSNTPTPLEKIDRLWLLGEAGNPLVDAVVARMTAVGIDVVHVTTGAAVARTDRAISLRPTETDDWIRVFTEALASHQMPSHLLYAWMLSPGALSVEDAAFYSLAALGSAMAQIDADQLPAVTVLAAGAIEVIGADVLHPHQALALGPVRTIPSEIPGVRTRLLDIGDSRGVSGSTAILAGVVAREIQHDGADSVIAYRHGRRFVPKLRTLDSVPDENAALPIRDGGVYLITGGTRGIGLEIASWLATQGRVHVCLVSRRGTVPSRDAGGDRFAQVRQQFLAAGSTVEVVVADVTKAGQVQDMVRKVEREHGPIRGVVHAAGLLEDGLLAFKSRDDMKRVLAPKVTGVQTLHSALGDRVLDFFVCSSSVSALAGLPGQSDYGAANAFLDAWCSHQSAQGTYPVLSLAWSAWRDTGMVARSFHPQSRTSAHPLLQQSMREAPQALFSTHLDVSVHWMMEEHRLSDGTSLVPGTGYLEIAHAALAPWASGAMLELRDVMFLQPLLLDGDAPREMRVATRTEGDHAEFVIVGALKTPRDGYGWEEHVLGRARRVPSASNSVDLAAVAAACPDHRIPPPDPNLRLGARWQNIRAAQIGPAQALLTLQLPPAYRDELMQYPLHPALMDMATAGAQCLIPGYDGAQEFYVPLSYGSVRIHDALTWDVRSVISLRPSESDDRDVVAFDVTITTPDGQVLVEIEEFMMSRVREKTQLRSVAKRVRRRSPLDVERIAPVSPAPHTPSWYEQAIRPEEGRTAFGLALQRAGLGYAHLLVAPRPVSAILAELTAAAEHGGQAPQHQSTGEGAFSAAAPSAPLGDVQQLLVTHEGVERAHVIYRADRTGDVRIVAYASLARMAHLTVSELRRALKRQLPPHQVPSMFVFLDSWPTTSEGSVDEARLPDPFGAEDDFVAPRTPIEQAIAEVWSEVLGIQQVGVHDNFFDIGGHSLLSVRVISRLDKRLGVRLNQANMVLQTLEQLAADCEKRGARVGGPS